MRSRVFVLNGFDNPEALSELPKSRHLSISDIVSGDCGHYLFSAQSGDLYTLNTSHEKKGAERDQGTSSQRSIEGIKEEPDGSKISLSLSKISIDSTNSRILQVSCSNHLIILMSDGTLYAKGGRIGRLKKLPFVP